MGASINNLPQASAAISDQVPFYSSQNGQDRRTSVNQLASLIAASFATNGALVTQYEAPNATGFTVAVLPPTSGASMFVLITAAAGYATGTIVYPAVSTLADGQELLFASTESVAALTTNGNGAIVNGAPSALSANDYFRMRYDRTTLSWYRVG